MVKLPRPTIDLVRQLITDLSTYIKDNANNNVDVRAGWVTAETKFPLVTVNKIGEFTQVISVSGDVKAGYVDIAIDLWSKSYEDLYKMEETTNSRIVALRRAYQNNGFVYNIDLTMRRIPEPDIAPLLIRTNILLRAWFFEEMS